MDLKFLDCCGIQDVVVNGEPNHLFEYEKTAYELAEKVDGEVVAVYYTSMYWLRDADYENSEHIGYGVLSDGELI